MKIVAIDTSTKVLSCALASEKDLVSERWQLYEKNHSVILMQLVQDMLEKSDVDISEVDVFAAVVGPGSFTGVRIGVSTIRALAHGWNKPVVGVNTLECMAMNVPIEGTYICPMLDARRHQVYTALYVIENGFPKEIKEPCAADFEDFIDNLPKDSNIVFLGDGAVKNETEILNKGGVVMPLNVSMPKASSAAVIALNKIKNGEAEKYNELQPYYLRESQAERALKEKEKNK